MPHKPNHKTRILERRQTAARLYLQGHTLVEIAKVCGCSFATISLDLKAVREEWRKVATDLMAEIVGRELARIDEIERQAWIGWFRSLTDKEVKVVEKQAKQDGGGEKRMLRREGQSGNPAFLAQVERCIERRCKLLGIEFKGSDVVSEATTLTPDQIAAAMDATVPAALAPASEPLIAETTDANIGVGESEVGG